MPEEVVPMKLHQMCGLLVRKHHADFGLGNLVSLLGEKDNFVVLASTPNTFTVMSTSVSAFRIRKVSWAVALVLLGLGVFVNWWFLVAVPLCTVVDRWAARTERDGYFYQAVHLLALEMLVQDMAGWGQAFPAQRQRALSAFEGQRRTVWLDYYLPRRAEISADVLAQLAPR